MCLIDDIMRLAVNSLYNMSQLVILTQLLGIMHNIFVTHKVEWLPTASRPTKPH